MIESKSKQIIPNMNWMGRNGRTRVNVSQTSLAIDSGATIHFFSNSELQQSIKTIKTAKIHCGGTSFDQCEVGLLRRELQHLPLPKKKIFLDKDEIANLVSLGKLVKEGFRVMMDSDGNTLTMIKQSMTLKSLVVWLQSQRMKMMIMLMKITMIQSLMTAVPCGSVVVRWLMRK